MSRIIEQTFIGDFQVDQLTPFPGNPNRGRTDLIEESIDRVGFYGAVLVQRSSHRILAGHHRVEAAKAQGLAQLPVLLIDVDDAEAERIVVGDNRIGRLGYDDDDDLQAMLRSILDGTDTLVGTGYTGDELRELTSRGDDPDGIKDAEPSEPPVKPETRKGDVWILGEHRLVCGDATDPLAYTRLLGDERAQLLVTDPPYNVDYVGKTADQLTIVNDHLADDEFAGLLLDSFTNAIQNIDQGGPAYVFHADSAGLIFRAAFTQAGWDLKQVLVWVKSVFALGRQDYQWQHEPILYGWRPGAAHRWHGGFDKSTLLDDGVDIERMGEAELRDLLRQALRETSAIREKKPHRNELHPTCKPVPLCARLISNSSLPGDLVLDPFAGSGSTMVACEGLGRRARLIELDPRYCDVILKRYADVSGQEATRG